MSLYAVPLAPEGESKLAAGHPQIAFTDLTEPRGLEPGRPVRLMGRGAEPLAWGIADPENEVVRVWSHEPVLAFDGRFFRRTLAGALAARVGLGLADGVSAYRLVNGDGDGLPGVAVDIYGAFAVVTALSRGLAVPARLLAGALPQVFADASLPFRGAVLKVRLKSKSTTPEKTKDEVVGETPPAKLIVMEGGVPCEVHLLGGLNTGLFIDMREHRRGLARFVKGRRVLNTFSYSGTLSVAAARAGAAHVTSVDLASGVLAWSRENARLAGLDPDDDTRFRFETSDVFRFLETAAVQPFRYDVIILDPPTVSGARASSWSQKNDYPDLIAKSCRLLSEEGGHLWISSNTHAGPSIMKHVTAGLALAKRRGAVLELGGLPPDFPTLSTWPSARYLEVAQLRVWPQR